MSATTASSSTPITRVAALGGGLIGQSWVALFLAAGLEVSVYDIDPGTDERVRRSVQQAWPVLVQLGLATTAEPDLSKLSTCTDAAEAVQIGRAHF